MNEDPCVTTPKPNNDAVAREVELALQVHGWYESWATTSFVDQLHRVEESMSKVISAAPGPAANLYETMIGGAQEATRTGDPEDTGETR